MFRSAVLASVIIFIFAKKVATEESYVYEYGPDNFKQRIEEMDGNFIMFYAPWCRHCTEFYPIWNELAELVNTKDSKFAIAQVDCTIHSRLCQENDISGYPSLLYYHKNTFSPVEYKGTRDLPSLTLFLSEVFNTILEQDVLNETDKIKDLSEVNIYSGMAYLNDHNIEKFVSKGQHFIMFYAPWCKHSQRLAPVWADLAINYAHNVYIQIGKVNCMENEMTCKNFDIKQYPYLLWIVNGRIMGVAEENTLDGLKTYVEKMVQAENHDPEKFMKKKKAFPVARITEETFDAFMEKDVVFINYFAPWCAHCMSLSPMWLKLGEKFQNDSRVLIADVNCVQSKSLCSMEKIHVFPTFVLYKYKKVVKKENGGRSLESLIALVNEYVQESMSTDVPGEASEAQSTTKDEL